MSKRNTKVSMSKSVHNINKIIFTILAYIGIFCLFIVPLLIPVGYNPVVKFYSESIALTFAMYTAMFAIFASDRIYISNIAIAALLFAILLLAQIVFLHINFPGINLVIALELVVGALLSIGITSLIGNNEASQKNLVLVVVWAVVISSTIQAVYGVMQYTGAAANYPMLVMFIHAKDSVFGNIGQRNDYADFLSIGVFALSYLFIMRRINLVIYTIYTIFFAIALTLSSSRTTFLYFIAAIIIGLIFMWKHQRNDEQTQINKQIIKVLVSVFIMLLVVEIFLPKIIPVLSGFDRFGDGNISQGTYRRFYEWYKDIIIFLQHPLLGAGWYQYSKQAVDLMMTKRFMYIPANTALYTHSHNSPLNILAETGIIGFLITVCYGFAYSVYHMFKSFNNHATLFIIFMCFTIFIQSLFQFPLWYAYFLMYFILFLSMDKAVFSFNNTKLIKGIILITTLGFTYFIFSNLTIYNQLAANAQVPNDNDDFKANVVWLQQLIDNNLIWAFPAILEMNIYNLPGSDKTNNVLPLQNQVKYVDMLGSELPYPEVIFKQMIVHNIAKEPQKSMYYADLLAHAFPYFKDKFAMRISSYPMFKDEVNVINKFKYQDRSVFAKIFSKKDEK